jgi:ABC-type multidrug transport system permease subunit
LVRPLIVFLLPTSITTPVAQAFAPNLKARSETSHRREEAMDLETTILALVLLATFILFGIGMFGIGFGD